MVRRMRGILTLAVPAAVLAALVGVACALMFPRLPDPAVANREQLLRWLVVRDLNKESEQTRQVLARRLDEEFCKGLDWEATGRLQDAQRQRLWSNLLVLLQPWFMQKTEQYFALPGSQRVAHLDQTIDTISAWQGVEKLRPDLADPPGNAADKGGLLAILFEQVQRWQAAADPQQRQQISEFLLALQARWLLRSIPWFRPESK